MNHALNANAWMRWLMIIALITLLPAYQTGDARRIDGVIGSVTGSIGGSYLSRYLGGGTAGHIAGAVAGSLAGYYVGAYIAGYLGEEDKQRMAQASKTAFDTGQTQTFSNPDNGVTGKAEIVPSVQAVGQNGECKTIRQTIMLGDGRTVTEDVKSCKEQELGYTPSHPFLSVINKHPFGWG